MLCTINYALYQVALDISAKKDLRNYLCSVHVEKHPEGGVVIVASDGNRLIVMYDEKGALEGAEQVNLPQLKLGRQKFGQQIQFDEVCATLGSTTQKCKLVEGAYLNWRDLLFLGEVVSGFPNYFDPGLLAGFDKVCRAYGRTFNTVRLVSSVSNRTQLGYLFFDMLPAIGVVLPIAQNSRIEAHSETVPLALGFKKEKAVRGEYALAEA